MSLDSTQQSKWKKVLPIAVVLAIGVAIGVAILLGGKNKSHAKGGEESHGTEAHARSGAAGPAKGPHGGRLFDAGDYGLELTIFETGVPPEFRLYAYRNGKLLDPSQTQATVTLDRLGRPPQTIVFTKDGDFLKGDAVIEEPHSFDVAIVARNAAATHRFAYEQVESRVTMSDEQAKSNGVEIATAGPARIRTALQLRGEIRLNEDRTVRVVPRLAGLVESVAANAGDTVRRGQLLAVLSSQSLADQRAEWLAAQKRVGLARITTDREKTLWEGRISAEQDYLQARQTMQEAEIAEQTARQKLGALGATGASPGNLTRYEVRSPIDGVVTDKKIAVGEVLKEDAIVFVVADLSTVWVEATVHAKEINAIRPGQDVTVKPTAFDANAVGKIAYVGALVGEQTRTATARIVLPNPDGVWRPGLTVHVDLTAAETAVALAIDADAVQTLRDRFVVFGRYGDQFEARPVELGRRDGSTVEVLRGLAPGERYATRNSFLIKADIGKAGASHDH